MRIRVLNWLWLIVCIAGLSVWGQKAPSAAPAPVKQRPLAVGVATASNVSDEIACLLLFRILADRPNGPSYAMRAAHVGAGQFSTDQTQIIMDVANRTVLAIKNMESELIASNLSLDVKSQTAQAQRQSILSTAISDLKTRLGPDGSQQWQTFLNNTVKPHVVTAGTM